MCSNEFIQDNSCVMYTHSLIMSKRAKHNKTRIRSDRKTDTNEDGSKGDKPQKQHSSHSSHSSHRGHRGHSGHSSHSSHRSHSSHKYRNISIPKNPSMLVAGDKFGYTGTELKENELSVPTTGAGLLQWDRRGFPGLIGESKNPMYKTTTIAELKLINSMPHCVRNESNAYFNDNSQMFQSEQGAELASVRTAAKQMEHLMNDFEPWRQNLTQQERKLFCEINPGFSLRQAYNAVSHGLLEGIRYVFFDIQIILYGFNYIYFVCTVFSNANPNTQIELEILKNSKRCQSLLEINSFQNKILLAYTKAQMSQEQRQAAKDELKSLIPLQPSPTQYQKMENEIKENLQIMDDGTDEAKTQFEENRNFVGYYSKTLNTFSKLVDNSMKNIDDLARIQKNNVFETATCDDKPGIDELKYVVCLFDTLLFVCFVCMLLFVDHSNEDLYVVCLFCVYVTFCGPLRQLISIINVAVSMTPHNQTSYATMVGAQTLYIHTGLMTAYKGYLENFRRLNDDFENDDTDIDDKDKKQPPVNVCDIVKFDEIVTLLNQVLYIFVF